MTENRKHENIEHTSMPEPKTDGRGMLYLCATPIGNLEDITLRVLRILKEADLIAAEDTRNSINLLRHFDIDTPLTSYHEYNKIEKAYQLADKMEHGCVVALITDAGMPGISDPGEELVKICGERGIPVTALPGASAVVTALAVSGQSTRRFAFEGFLPREKKERTAVLGKCKDETRTLIFYEAPHRLTDTLKLFLESFGNRQMTVCRELTKRFETVWQTTIEEALQYYKNESPRGEFVLVIEGRSQAELEKEKQQEWEAMTIAEHVQYYIEEGMTKKDAMKLAAKDRGVGKREIYQALIE